ncbi:DNA polymerase III subunit alpha [Streptomyces noursei ZPM]|uniref:DNA polymerase III subunit alpha n=1 Tax=Streptomyces noursei TaxID=1971 RepID=A0A401QX07_STRNR|nr:DNA polymerase III subunit alpha [Streptomyces noursei]AKA02593.1 DNA polymerase III subunit alpha [Streptomyces noursei ZPM]EOT05361.1 DNA polymerase III subunit alpha [Streptomyces noursei CCRC 11814]EXU90506.1 DNA polymerase III subunit alpha [Streptomyces noursei PD-1]UWS71101.1 DNA polymerase III subunit alpha [Streptomyces noursei]GCB89883.1 DNA-directed DNA polymerase [Streptomyces noursei]
MSDSFVHLHNHTEYSMLDGAQKLKPMFAEVARQQMPAIAMSDHGNMFGAYEFAQVAKGFDGVKPIIGIEAYVAPSSRFTRKREFWGPGGRRAVSDDGEGSKDVSGGGRFTHMTMWARNVQGLRNLFWLSTQASYEGQFPAGKPRMDRELIAQRPDGIIATTGCPSGEVQTRLRLGQYAEARAAAGAYQDLFGRENYFLELMDHGLDIERTVRDDLLRLAKDLDIPLLATNDAHYVTEDQADAHDNLLCIGVGKNKADPHRFRFNGSGYYLKSAAEMRRLFAELPAACDHTLLVAERVEPYDAVFDHVDEMPQFPDLPEGETQESWLRKEVLKGLSLRYGDPVPPHVLERFETEMAVIGPMGFSSYFLVVADICRHARDNRIPIGPGRGSATGSLVAYATRITELCPLEHGLLFERFLNPERINPPDVDLDFDDRQRDRMVRYVTEKYGDAFTALVNTFGKIKAKNAIKDSSRILGYPYAHGERITKALPPDQNGKSAPLAALFDPAHERYAEAGEIRRLYATEPDVQQVIDTARGVEGLTRGTGVHAAAVILSKTRLTDRIPLHMRAADGARITGFDYPSCEAMGLVKMDFLGLRNLGVIDQALANIRGNRGVRLATVDPLDGDPATVVIPLDDAPTYRLLADGNTFGVFQLDGGGMRALLRLMEPTRFEDIAAANALYRPGPMAANAHTNYALRQNGKQDPTPIHPELKEALEPILGSTHHLLIFQEQIMAIARQLAGYTLGGADMLRRAMGKKKPEVLAAEWEKFHGGMRDNGYSDEAIRALWDVMLPFSGYAFNKSHTAGYGLVSYWTAYLKANYPAEYMAALLTSVGDDKDKAAVYLADARKNGVRVLQPDVNESVAEFTAIGDDVRFGLRSVRNVGDAVIEAVVDARRRKGKFTSFADFVDKVELPALNKRAVESLIKAGAFDSLGHTRKGLTAVHEGAIDAIIPVKKAAGFGQDDLFAGLGGGADDRPAFGLDLPIDAEEWPRRHLLATEREMLGLYVSAHPLDGAEHVLAGARDCSLAELLGSGRTTGEVQLSGLITGIQRKVTKQGNAWAIVTLADRDASIEVLFFPAAYQLVQPALTEDAVIAVRGRIEDRDGTLNVFGRELAVLDLSAAEHGGRPPVRLAFLAHRLTEDGVHELKRLLADHPGDHPVHLSVRGSAKTTVYALPATVDAGTLASDVKGAFGAEAWAGLA